MNAAWGVQAKAASTVQTASKAASPNNPTSVSVAARAGLLGVAQEQAQEVEALLRGTLPAWLAGTFLLNGGGDYTGMEHMFDGYALISKMRVSGGRVFGSQRYLQSDAYKHFSKTGKMKFREFATAIPTKGNLEFGLQLASSLAAIVTKKDAFTDNASVNLMPLPDGSVLAMSESMASLYKVDPTTLDTLQHVEYTDGIPGDLSTAHPKLMADGTIINFSRSLPYGGYHIYKQDPHTLTRTQIAFIKDRHPLAPAWVHDMCMTANHLVIVEPPLYFNMPSLLLGTEREFQFLDWQPKDGTRVHVVSLKDGQVRTYNAPPFFVFHYANAHESPEGTRLYVDMGTYADPTIVNQLALPALMAFPGEEVADAPLRRLTIPLDIPPSEAAMLQAPQPLLPDDSCYGSFFDFPALHPKNRGKEYRYVWGMACKRPTNMGNAVAKHDLVAGTTKMWHEEGATAGEATFLPTPGGTAEDDGVLLSLVMARTGKSFMLVLDASSMLELARAELPYAVPYRFHGGFLPEHAQK
ncbi:MAG: hypothetical protein WDW36_001474 [Sanguina aurantia]